MLKSNEFNSWQVSQSSSYSFCLFASLSGKDEPSLTIQTFLRSQVCPFPKNPILQAQREEPGVL